MSPSNIQAHPASQPITTTGPVAAMLAPHVKRQRVKLTPDRLRDAFMSQVSVNDIDPSGQAVVALTGPLPTLCGNIENVG